MSSDKILEIILYAIPYPSQITDIDTTEDKYVYFSWRGDRYRVGDRLDVNEVDGGMVTGSNSSILLRALLKKRAIEIEV